MNKKQKKAMKKANVHPLSLPDGYNDALTLISSKIKSAQAKALSAVNYELIEVYRDIGKTIQEKLRSGGWGDSIVERLAQDLQNNFPGMRGFSARNLWRMNEFYLTYFKNEKLTTLSSEISWSHNVALLVKCNDLFEKEFYMRMSKKNGWTYRVLIHQIENGAYEKMLKSQSNFEKNLPTNLHPEAKLAVIDEYALGFLELADAHTERQLERAIVSNIEQFLRAVGNAYSFIGSQYRIEIDGREFLIDLLFYNRRLKALVAIELKVSEFIPEYVGKMQFYLSVLDEKVRLPEENPSIGIILCKSKSRTIVEYALKTADKPINVSTYNVVKKLPKSLEDELPSPEQISILLGHIK